MNAKTKNTAKKVSAIDAIRQPFQFESKSTQTHSPVKDFRIGGVEKTVSVFNPRKGDWESKTTIEGGEVLKVSHRIRTGKTKRERAVKAKLEKDAPVVEEKKKAKKK